MRKEKRVREDGFIYIGTYNGVERWLSPAAYQRSLDRTSVRNAAREAARKKDPKLAQQALDAQTAWRRADYRRGMFVRCKTASKHGIPFNLETYEDIPFATHCPVFGVPLVMGEGAMHPFSPSLDRIIPKLGYTKGNIIVVSLRANTIKSDAMPDEILKVAKFYQRLSKKK